MPILHLHLMKDSAQNSSVQVDNDETLCGA